MEATLSSLKKGQKGTVIKIDSGRALRQRLMSIGVNRGSEVKVLKKGKPGPLIVSIKDCCRVALGFGEASKITVNVVE